MFKYIKNILNKGLGSDKNQNQDKIVVITNFILILACLVALCRVLVFYYIGDVKYALVSLYSTLAFFSLYILNIKGYQDIARIALIFIGNLATGYKELTSGGYAGQIYLIVASFGVVFLLFNIKDKKKFYLALSIPTINVLLNMTFPYLFKEQFLEFQKQFQIIHPNYLDLEVKDKIIGIVSNVIISVLIIWYFVKKSNDKEQLLIANNLLLNNYNQDLEKQKEIIQVQNEEIYAAIRYAQRIQNTILPWESTLKSAFTEHFVIYRPKDIVSGDFYWLHQSNDATYFAVADCTGHGISGSMLSMIGTTILEEAVSTKNLTNTDEILKYFDYKLTIALNQQIEENNSRDSIEAGLIKIQHSTLEFSGARHNLYYFEGDELQIIKGDRISIGGDNIAGDNYTLNLINLKENSTLYLTTDGFGDQIGTNGKKFGSNKLKELMKSNHKFDLIKQKSLFENELNNHKGTEEQRDDITLIGIRI